MEENKIPDQVVYNKEEQKFDAFLKTYSTSLSGPKIEMPNVVSWKSNNIYTANKQFASSFEEIKTAYEDLLREYEQNVIIYEAEYSFEPIVGNTYYLYRNKREKFFLSILSPTECNFNYVGTFKLNSDKVWKKID